MYFLKIFLTIGSVYTQYSTCRVLAGETWADRICSQTLDPAARKKKPTELSANSKLQNSLKYPKIQQKLCSIPAFEIGTAVLLN